MKKIALILAVLLFSICGIAQPPPGPADKGMVFGQETTADGALKADQLAGMLKANSTAEVKIMGKVSEVCKMEGCWLKMQTSGGLLMIRMKDHSFMVPLAINGKTIVARGTASIQETSVETLKHYAEDAGKSKEEIAAIKEPKKEIIMNAVGILVM